MPAPDHNLFVHEDPATVGAWCRERAVSGSVYVAPSAAARRHAIRRVVDARGVTLGLTVTSPGRLLPLLELRAGLAPPRMLTPTLERMLVSAAARDACVPLFDDAGFDAPAGAVQVVGALIRSLRLNGIGPGQYRDSGGDARAAEAYARFEAARAGLGYADEAERIARLIDAGMPSVPLVLEDPAIPHRAALELLRAAVGAAPSCQVGISRCWADGATSSTLAHLEALGFSPRQAPSVERTPPAMRAIGGVGMHDELELVAREMLRLIRGGDASVQPGDILGVAPNGTYLLALHESCRRLGIPVASPRRMDVLEVPLVRTLLETFALLAEPDEDTPERGLALLGTPYVGLTLNQHDRLARELIRRGLGSLRSWRRHAASTGRARFAEFTQAVPLLAKQIEGLRAPRELATTLASLGLDHGFVSSGRRSGLSAERDDSVRMDQQGWETLTRAVEELDLALHESGVRQLTARRWLGELTASLVCEQVRMDARGAQGVHLTIAGAGLPTASHVFAVGWREGLVPRRTRDDPLLPDRVKRTLNAAGGVLPLGADRAAAEYERRERVWRAARESLTISWPSTGADGEQLLPSFYLDDLGVTDRTVRGAGDTTWPVPLAASRGERVARATFLARHRPAADLGEELELVRTTLGSLTHAEQRAYDGALHGKQTFVLPADVTAELAPLAGSMSASQARMVAHCLYEHFGKRRLQLEALVAPQLDARLLGVVAHGVLNDLGALGFDPAALDVTLDRWWAEQLPVALRDGHHVRFEREMLGAQLAALVAGEHAHLLQSGSRAAHFELSFGLDGAGRDAASRPEGLRVALPEGAMLAESTLRGSIDRVDVVERDGRLYGVAVDYKLGRGDSNRTEMDEMADFQLPIYCEVLPRFGIEPVGAFYLGIASNERSGVIREEFADVFLPAASKGVSRLAADGFDTFMRDRQHALRSEIARMAHGVLVTRPRRDDCKYCDLCPVCRIGTFGIGGTRDDE